MNNRANPYPFATYLEVTVSTNPALRKDDTVGVDSSSPSLAWQCCYCPSIRVWEGSRPDLTRHCEWCPTCQHLCIVHADDWPAVSRLIDQNLP